MATDLERVGDLSRNIGKSAMRLAERPPFDPPPELSELCEAARRQLRAALDAFTQRDPEKARQVLEGDDRVDRLQDRIVREAILSLETEPAFSAQRVDVILIAESLERVGDHATNIAEDVILVAEARNVKHAAKLG
jgi:phosphate transport system protein